MLRLLSCSMLLALVPQAAQAMVVFENAGTTDGWGRVYTQRAGTLTAVASPAYKSGSALKMAQTYQTSDASNYHSEVVKNMAGLADQDLYYGQAIYLPADWVFHDQNVTFQQWAPEDPAGPWILMFVQKDQLRVGGKGITGMPVLATITGLRGTWIRVVTRIHQSTNGIFEVWVNGQKTLSQPGDFHS